MALKSTLNAKQRAGTKPALYQQLTIKKIKNLKT
jgi:hypothetical protein